MKNERIKNCPYQKSCGACVSIGKEYAVTLKEKEEAVRKLLKPFVSLEGITGMENPYHYRNKNHRVCAYERLGRRERAVSGIYAEGTHKVIPVGSCLIEDEAAGAIFDTVLELAKSFKYRFYDEDMGRGLLRHILIRTAHKTGQIMVVLVLADPVLPGKNNFVKALTARHPEITTIVLNVNRKPTSMILGEKETVAYGKGYIEDELCGRRFRISAHSFYQVNSVQTEKLYGKAIELMDLKADDVLLDAYCGIGTIGIIASGSAGKVIGVEANSGAVRDAVDNAKRNGVKNISFAAEDAGAFLSRTLLKKTPLHAVVMDPPRSGATEEFLQALTTAAPSRIVYISCNPETLARDLRYLTGHGYLAVTARAFDLFPWTSHVETVVLMSKVKE